MLPEELTYCAQFTADGYKLILEQYKKELPMYLAQYGLEPSKTVLVARGYSGTPFALALAAHFGTLVAIVRKKQDGAHSGNRIEGHRSEYDATMACFDEPWVFIDDFIDSGETLAACEEIIGKPPTFGLLWASFTWPFSCPETMHYMEYKK